MHSNQQIYIGDDTTIRCCGILKQKYDLNSHNSIEITNTIGSLFTSKLIYGSIRAKCNTVNECDIIIDIKTKKCYLFNLDTEDIFVDKFDDWEFDLSEEEHFQESTLLDIRDYEQYKNVCDTVKRFTQHEVQTPSQNHLYYCVHVADMAENIDDWEGIRDKLQKEWEVRSVKHD